jgi:hypothetical protein
MVPPKETDKLCIALYIVLMLSVRVRSCTFGTEVQMLKKFQTNSILQELVLNENETCI